MSAQFRIVSLFSLIGLSGIFAGSIIWLSPNPLPMAHTQLLTACIALFSASGYALLRMLSPAARSKNKPIVMQDKGKARHALSIEGPNPEVESRQPNRVSKSRLHVQP